jgi:pSer/pThr/pTyr-binding forkhead associated (FHA) protein
MFTLKVYRGDKVVQELDLDAPEVKIGRSPDNAVVLPDDGKGVSRVHAMIRLEDGIYVLYDGNSRNGTFVDGKPIKRMPIQPGQDFVIGPYRLMFGSSDYSGSMPTIVATRTEPSPAPAAPVKEGTAKGAGREGTTKGGATQTKTAEGSTKSRPVATGKTIPGGGKAAQKQGMPVAYVAVGAIAAIVVLGVVIWQLLPDTPEQQVVVTTTVVTTSVPETTTTIPPTTTIDPHAEQIAQATLALEEVEKNVTEKRFVTAQRQINQILKEIIAPILAIDPQYPAALEFETRAKTRLAEIREIVLAATPPPPVTPKRGPDDVADRPGESPQDYARRNTEVKQDYALAKKYFNDGDHFSALKLFVDLNNREPGYLDVSAYVKNAQDAVDKERQQALNEALRIEGEGHKLMNARNIVEAASTLLSARKAFERAAALQAPGVEKLIGENLARRRVVAKQALDLAYTHANRRNRAEALKFFQLVIDLLPQGEGLRNEAEAGRQKLAPPLVDSGSGRLPKSVARHTE